MSAPLYYFQDLALLRDILTTINGNYANMLEIIGALNNMYTELQALNGRVDDVLNALTNVNDSLTAISTNTNNPIPVTVS